MLVTLEELKVWRNKLGFSQRKLALLAEINPSIINKIESGKRDPTYSTVVKIYNTLQREMNKGKISKSAGEICYKDVQCVKPNDTLNRASEIMKKNDFSQLPVMENKELVGSISERSFTELLSSEKPVDFKKQKVKEFMEDEFPSFPKDTPITSISRILKDRDAIIVTDKGKMYGIITRADLLPPFERKEE